MLALGRQKLQMRLEAYARAVAMCLKKEKERRYLVSLFNTSLQMNNHRSGTRGVESNNDGLCRSTMGLFAFLSCVVSKKGR